MPLDQTTAQDTWDLLTCDAVDSVGNRFWFDENGEFHRENGPAIVNVDGSVVWFKHGKFHREDGPAYIGPAGHPRYWVNGEVMTEKRFNRWKNSNAT